MIGRLSSSSSSSVENDGSFCPNKAAFSNDELVVRYVLLVSFGERAVLPVTPLLVLWILPLLFFLLVVLGDDPGLVPPPAVGILFFFSSCGDRSLLLPFSVSLLLFCLDEDLSEKKPNEKECRFFFSLAFVAVSLLLHRLLLLLLLLLLSLEKDFVSFFLVPLLLIVVDVVDDVVVVAGDVVELVVRLPLAIVPLSIVLFSILSLMLLVYQN